MRRSTTVNVIVHYPKTEAGVRELEQRVAAVHVDAAQAYIERLTCPAEQKIALAAGAASKTR